MGAGPWRQRQREAARPLRRRLVLVLVGKDSTFDATPRARAQVDEAVVSGQQRSKGGLGAWGGGKGAMDGWKCVPGQRARPSARASPWEEEKTTERKERGTAGRRRGRCVQQAQVRRGEAKPGQAGVRGLASFTAGTQRTHLLAPAPRRTMTHGRRTARSRYTIRCRGKGGGREFATRSREAFFRCWNQGGRVSSQRSLSSEPRAGAGAGAGAAQLPASASASPASAAGVSPPSGAPWRPRFRATRPQNGVTSSNGDWLEHCIGTFLESTQRHTWSIKI